MALYVVGDIHGYLGQLERALALIEADGGGEVVFVGDLVDRGPQSRGVIERLMAGQAEGQPWTVLMGNHDRMFWRFVTHGIVHDPIILSGKSWLHGALGGQETLASYGVERTDEPVFIRDDDDVEQLVRYPTRAGVMTPEDLAEDVRGRVPRDHLDWIDTRPQWHQAEGFTFVHAGLRPGVALENQVEADLIWIRDTWLDSDGHADHRVVHGHTVVEEPTDYGHRVNVDAGAGYGNPLVPCVWDDGAWWTLWEAGRQPMRTTDKP